MTTDLMEAYQEVMSWDIEPGKYLEAFGLSEDDVGKFVNSDECVNHIRSIYQQCLSEYEARKMWQVLSSDHNSRIGMHASACNALIVGVMIGILIGRDSMIEKE